MALAGPGATAPSASVVVATVGRPGRLRPLVDAVLSDPGTLEVVVVVDGPDPESLAVLARLSTERPEVRALGVDRRGQLGALEEGVRLASGDVVVLLDDDVIPEPGTIGGHAAHHRRSPGQVVAGPMPVVVPDGTTPSVGTRLYAAEYLHHVAALEVGHVGVLDVLWTGNLSLRRADCLRVGLSSSYRAHYHADRDLGYRLAAAGLAGVFDPSLGARHLHSRTDREFLRDAARQGAGRVALHRAHVDRLGPFRSASLVDDLAAPLRLAVRCAGSSDHLAEPAARWLMALGRAAGTVVGLDVQLAAAKLARRVMQWHGAQRAAGAEPPGVARA